MTAKGTNASLREDSLPSRISALQQGQNLTIARPLANGSESFDAWITATKRLMGKEISAPLARVKERHPERVFETETGTLLTSGNRIYVTLIVTRLADET